MACHELKRKVINTAERKQQQGQGLTVTLANELIKKKEHTMMDQRKKNSRKLTFDSLATVELDLPLPLWRVGLHHDEGASWDSTVEFALGPAGACQSLRGVMRGAWVAMH